MEIKILKVEKLDPVKYQQMLKENLENEAYFFPINDLITVGDNDFTKQAERIRVGAFDGDELIGFTHGSAISKNGILMEISVVDTKYRNLGIYKKLLDKFLDLTVKYDEVHSYHHLFNNTIISIKLRKDFYISGFDQSSFLGPRVMLKYFHNKKLLEVMKFRVGLTSRPDHLLNNNETEAL